MDMAIDRYLFKAKRIDNGEWEIGSLIALPTGEYEIGNKCINPPDSDPMWKKVLITHKVDPSTICQCTGLRDKNGELIWENDVVLYSIEKELWYRGVIVWEKEISIAGWKNKICYSHNGYQNYKTESGCTRIDRDFALERIGNIFDNPELLEVEDDGE